MHPDPSRILSERINQTVRALDTRLEFVDRLEVKWPGAQSEAVKSAASTLWLGQDHHDEHFLNLYAKGMFLILTTLEWTSIPTKGQATTPEQMKHVGELFAQAQEIADEWWRLVTNEKEPKKLTIDIRDGLKVLAENVRLSENAWQNGLLFTESKPKLPSP